MWNNCTVNGVLTIPCIGPLFNRILGIALSFAGVVSLFLIIAAGITFITSGGGKQVEQAKNMLTYAIVGLVIVLLAIFIINLVAGATGVTCIIAGVCK
ncbi:MAG TPA: hypothetical protein VLB73_04480 [Patescibacteria group bacterium]|nr:hypothetical protein [Patescibacteria group bacterium]